MGKGRGEGRLEGESEEGGGGERELEGEERWGGGEKGGIAGVGRGGRVGRERIEEKRGWLKGAATSERGSGGVIKRGRRDVSGEELTRGGEEEGKDAWE